jgi:hypothetical protein
MAGVTVDLNEPRFGSGDDAIDFVLYSPATDINGNVPVEPSIYKIFSDSDEIATPEPGCLILVLAALPFVGFCWRKARV